MACVHALGERQGPDGVFGAVHEERGAGHAPSSLGQGRAAARLDDRLDQDLGVVSIADATPSSRPFVECGSVKTWLQKNSANSR